MKRWPWMASSATEISKAQTMIEQRETPSAGQRIASLRQFFQSRRGDGQANTAGDRSGFEPTLWPETEWSDTRFDPFGENG